MAPTPLWYPTRFLRRVLRVGAGTGDPENVNHRFARPALAPCRTTTTRARGEDADGQIVMCVCASVQYTWTSPPTRRFFGAETKSGFFFGLPETLAPLPPLATLVVTLVVVVVVVFFSTFLAGWGATPRAKYTAHEREREAGVSCVRDEGTRADHHHHDHHCHLDHYTHHID